MFTLAEVRQELRQKILLLGSRGTAPPRLCRSMLSDRRLLAEIAGQLERSWTFAENVPEMPYFFYLSPIKEVNGSKVPYVSILPKAVALKVIELNKESQFGIPAFSCFVGCRFIRRVRRDLEYNLRSVLSDLGINVLTSDYPGTFRRILDDGIIDAIDRSQFCIFDARFTSNKPNVYVEVGIAYLRRKQIFFFEPKENLGGFHSPGWASDFEGFYVTKFSRYKSMLDRIVYDLPIVMERLFVR